MGGKDLHHGGKKDLLTAENNAKELLWLRKKKV